MSLFGTPLDTQQQKEEELLIQEMDMMAAICKRFVVALRHGAWTRADEEKNKRRREAAKQTRK